MKILMDDSQHEMKIKNGISKNLPEPLFPLVKADEDKR
jgi:hypothetical protein